MRSTKKALILLVAANLLGMLTLACLYTRHDIHITLDVRHIQQTASSIEDVVAGEKSLEEIEPKAGSGLLSLSGARLARLIAFSSTAYAQDEASALKKMTPQLEKAIKNRQQRAAKIRQYKSAAAVGENKLALLETRPSDLLKEKGEEIRAAVKDENRDRQIIYQEIANQNSASGTASVDELTEVQQAWAEVNRAKSKSGDAVQVPTDAKYLRRFLNSAIGQKLEERPEPGAWIKVP